MDLGKLLDFARSLEVADMQTKVMEAEREGKVNFVERKKRKVNTKGLKRSQNTDKVQGLWLV